MSTSNRGQETEDRATNVISFTELDPKFKYEVSDLPGAEQVMLCFQCGTCTAGCPIARITDHFRPNKLIHMIQLGLRDRVLSKDDIWLCTTCFTCIDRCPQDVGFANIIRGLRNLTAREGDMPAVYKELADNILKTGYAYKITGMRLKRRKEEGLPSPSKGRRKQGCQAI